MAQEDDEVEMEALAHMLGYIDAMFKAKTLPEDERGPLLESVSVVRSMMHKVTKLSTDLEKAKYAMSVAEENGLVSVFTMDVKQVRELCEESLGVDAMSPVADDDLVELLKEAGKSVFRAEDVDSLLDYVIGGLAEE